MRRALEEWTVAALIVLLGLIFAADYQLGWLAARTWPAVLILWGAFRAASVLAETEPAFVEAPPQLPQRPSVFGPALLILLGGLLLANNYSVRFSLTAVAADGWPWILVAWGGSWMIEDFAGRAFYFRRPRPLGGGSLVFALLLCLLGIGAHGVFGSRGLLALLADG